MSDTNYVRVNPKLEWVVYDENNVVVAVVAHEKDARKLCGPLSTYGYFSDHSQYVGTNKVGQDVNRLFDANDRKELGLPGKNLYAVR